MALAGLNITGGRGNGVSDMAVNCNRQASIDFSFIMAFHSLHMDINRLISRQNFNTLLPFTNQQL